MGDFKKMKMGVILKKMYFTSKCKFIELSDDM